MKQKLNGCFSLFICFIGLCHGILAVEINDCFDLTGHKITVANGVVNVRKKGKTILLIKQDENYFYTDKFNEVETIFLLDR